MKILRKSKDYSDHISSGDMVDKTVVYDWRNEIIVPNKLGSFGLLKTGYKIHNTHRSLDQAVYVVLELGRKRYLFTVYEYLSSLKDIVPEDNRTDVQIAEAHGFDKKTSFRNIK